MNILNMLQNPNIQLQANQQKQPANVMRLPNLPLYSKQPQKLDFNNLPGLSVILDSKGMRPRLPQTNLPMVQKLPYMRYK